MKKDWYVYIVRCADQSLYTGITTDIKRRLDEHNHSNSIGARYTRNRRPVKLEYSEVHATRSAASIREHAIKKLPLAHKNAMILQKS